MSDRRPKLLDAVALLRDVPEYNLARGQVGVVVDIADDGSLLVEFADGAGVEFATPTLVASDLLVLAYEPEGAK